MHLIGADLGAKWKLPVPTWPRSSIKSGILMELSCYDAPGKLLPSSLTETSKLSHDLKLVKYLHCSEKLWTHWFHVWFIQNRPPLENAEYSSFWIYSVFYMCQGVQSQHASVCRNKTHPSSTRHTEPVFTHWSANKETREFQNTRFIFIAILHCHRMCQVWAL